MCVCACVTERGRLLLVQQDYSDQSTAGGLSVISLAAAAADSDGLKEIHAGRTGLYTDTEEDEQEDVSVPRSAIVEEQELQQH